MGGVHNTHGNSQGVGEGGFLCSENGNSGEVGVLHEIPPWWGYGYFLELHNDLGHFKIGLMGPLDVCFYSVTD